MDRRAFLAALVVVCGCGPDEAPKKAADVNRAAPAAIEALSAKPASADGQSQAKVPHVAVLVFGKRYNPSASSTASSSAGPALIRDRLRELGYVDGRNIRIEERYADGDSQRLAQLAGDIVASKPDVIVTIAASATAAARKATSDIPIVMAHAGSPVESGLVASLAHPGGNVTGTTSMIPDLGVKQVELLRELMPGLTRLGVLLNPTNAGAPTTLANVSEAARRLNIGVIVGEVSRMEDFDPALGRIRDAHPDALLVMMEPLIGMNREKLLDFAAANRLPASIDVGTEFVRNGALLSYGPVLAPHYALVADYVDKILKGAKPGELPVQQPTVFALIINVKTAKKLGLTVPQSLLARADEVIQ